MFACHSLFPRFSHQFDRLRDRSLPALMSLVDQGVVSGFGFLTGIAAARIVDIEAFGRFALVMIMVSLAQSVHNALVTAPMMTIAGTRKHDQRAYYVSLLAWAMVLSLIGGLLAATVLGVLFYLRGETLFFGFLAATATLTLAQNLQFTLRRVLFARSAGIRALAMDMARAIAFPTVAVTYRLAGGVITVESLIWILAATALATTLPFAAWVLRDKFRGFHLMSVVRRHAPLARWLLPVVIVTFSQEQVVWIIAAGALGDQAIGGLRAAQYVVGLVLLFMAATENIVPVGAGRALSQGGQPGLNRYLVSTGIMLGGLVLVLLVAISVPAPLLLKLIFGPAFAPYAACLRLLALAVVFVFVRDMVAQMFRATQRTGTIFRAFTASLLVSLAVLYPLLSHAGLIGAALVVLIGHFTSMIYLLAAAWGGAGRVRRWASLQLAGSAYRG